MRAKVNNRKRKYKIVLGVEGETEKNYFSCLKEMKCANWEIDNFENSIKPTIDKITSKYKRNKNKEVDLICLVFDTDNNHKNALIHDFNRHTPPPRKYKNRNKRAIKINNYVEIALFLNRFEFETFLLFHFEDCCNRTFNNKNNIVNLLKPHLDNCPNLKIADKDKFKKEVFAHLKDRAEDAIKNSIDCNCPDISSDCGKMLRYIENFEPIK